MWALLLTSESCMCCTHHDCVKEDGSGAGDTKGGTRAIQMQNSVFYSTLENEVLPQYYSFCSRRLLSACVAL